MATLEIPGQPELTPILQAINGSPALCGDFDPVMLVRAVNALHTLGKEQALAALREFLRLAGSSQGPNLPANIDTANRDGVFLIVRLLFEPAEPAGAMPGLFIGQLTPRPPDQDEALWPLYPLLLREDVPFDLLCGVMLAGRAEDPSAHVTWAEQHGKLRTQPLHPSDDPVAVAEQVMALPQFARLAPADQARYLGRVRRQVRAMVAPLLPGPVKVTPDLESDADWSAFKGALSSLKLQWDAQAGKYVTK